MRGRDGQVRSPGVYVNPNATKLLERRYLQRKSDGTPAESPEGMCHRVARAVAASESKWEDARGVHRWEDVFFTMLDSGSFLPNSPTLMNAGVAGGQLSACFVLPLEERLDAFLDTLSLVARVQHTGGGTGFSLSHLLPHGESQEDSGLTGAGPIAFLKAISALSDCVSHGGKRRGANMGVLRVDHPDILTFIRAKISRRFLHNFNLSVAVTADFRHCLEKGTFTLRHPVTGKAVHREAPQRIFRAISRAAWDCGDPGVIFLDRIQDANPLPSQGLIEATNPCGEIPLLPFEACNLGSINLARMVMTRGDVIEIDWDKLHRTARDATRFLDDVIDASSWPDRRITSAVLATRKIGLGVMGFADLLDLLAIPYSAPQAIHVAQDIARAVQSASHETSRELAHQRGNFPLWEASIFAALGDARRNATCTAIAPTGSISIILGTSSGIEPHLSMATEIDPQQHLLIQAAFQKHVDNAVAKTVNMAKEASVLDVEAVFRKAFELNLKGVTIYRAGSLLEVRR